MGGEGVIDDDIAALFGRSQQSGSGSRSIYVEPPEIEGVVHPSSLVVPAGVGTGFASAEDGAAGERGIVRFAPYVARFVDECTGAGNDVLAIKEAKIELEASRHKEVAEAAGNPDPGVADPGKELADPAAGPPVAAVLVPVFASVVARIAIVGAAGAECGRDSATVSALGTKIIERVELLADVTATPVEDVAVPILIIEVLRGEVEEPEGGKGAAERLGIVTGVVEAPTALPVGSVEPVGGPYPVDEGLIADAGTIKDIAAGIEVGYVVGTVGHWFLLQCAAIGG